MAMEREGQSENSERWQVMLADYAVGLGVAGDLRKFHRLCDILLHKKLHTQPV